MTVRNVANVVGGNLLSQQISRCDVIPAWISSSTVDVRAAQ